MRLDKFLKVSRVIKRRVVAADAAKGSKVLINGRIAKPATEVKVGDTICINYFKKIVEIKVISIEVPTRIDGASDMYEVVKVIDKQN